MAKSKLLENLKTEIRRRNYSYRTEQAYRNWVVRYVKFHHFTYPTELSADHVVAFLNYLAVDRSVAASTQNQALSALIFLYEHVLQLPMGKTRRAFTKASRLGERANLQRQNYL